MSALLELNDLKKHFLVTGLWRICGGGAPCAGRRSRSSKKAAARRDMESAPAADEN
jgi:hypothetical protein